jgi:hypothetical protein
MVKMRNGIAAMTPPTIEGTRKSENNPMMKIPIKRNK